MSQTRFQNKSIHIPFIIILYFFIQGCSNLNEKYNIMKYGANPNGKSISTKAIQKAIDIATKNGGGTVVFPKGTYLSGTVYLKTNVNLELERGAILLGSPNIEDYDSLTWGHNKDRQPWHLIYGDSVSNVSIYGEGLIDGNGKYFWQDYEKDTDGNMITPRWIKAKEHKISPLIDINNSKNISIRNISIKTGGGWNLHLFNCDLAWIEGVKIINNIYSPNSDGIDLSGCHDIHISNCFIRTCDDAICLKTLPNSRETKRVTITNCIMETLCVGVKLGASESYKNMSDVTISNCVINNSSRLIGLYSKNGGLLDNILITNITGNTNAKLVLNRPIQMMVEKNNGKIGGIQNVIISNLTCTTEGRVLLTCEEGGIMKNIVLRDIILNYLWIEDPTPLAKNARSNQFPKKVRHPLSGGARAAVVAENIKNLVVDNVMINWPESSDIPIEWKHPERIENGSTKIHRYDYKSARQTEFSVLWGYNLKNVVLRNPLATSSNYVRKKYDLTNCTIKGHD